MRSPKRALDLKSQPFALCSFASILLLFGCAGAPPRSKIVDVSTILVIGQAEEGMASWYGKEEQGGPTASGERFDMHAFTAAHRKLPLGTQVRVTNLANGRQVAVRINDRGPYGKGRIIDLSYAAASALDFIDRGFTRVKIEVLAR